LAIIYGQEYNDTVMTQWPWANFLFFAPPCIKR